MRSNDQIECQPQRDMWAKIIENETRIKNERTDVIHLGSLERLQVTLH